MFGLYNEGMCDIKVRYKVHSIFSFVTHLAVTDTVDHLVIFTVEGVCEEAQALQENKYETAQSRRGEKATRQQTLNQHHQQPITLNLLCHLSSQLLLPIHQALDVSGVIAAALTGRDGALKRGAGDL